MTAWTWRTWKSYSILWSLFSLQSLWCGCVESVASWGQHRDWSVSNSTGHSQHLHHGFQGINSNTCMVAKQMNYLLLESTNHSLFPCRHSYALTTVTVRWWRRFSMSTSASCISISQKQPWSRFSPHCALLSTRSGEHLVPCLMMSCPFWPQITAECKLVFLPFPP